MQNINLIKLQKFKNTLSSKNKEIVDTIIKNTIYISTEELVEMVKTSLIKFINKHPKYNLYMPTDKIGSEHYLMLKLEDLLNPIYVINDKITKNTKLPNDYPILIIDDAIYSSVNMCSYADNLRYNNVENEIYCVVGILSSQTVQVVEDFNVNIIAHHILEDKMICNLFEDYNFEYFYKHFECESHYVLPVFFEHKIANEFGSYIFYHDICEKPINRTPIDSISLQDIDEFIKRLECKL